MYLVIISLIGIIFSIKSDVPVKVILFISIVFCLTFIQYYINGYDYHERIFNQIIAIPIVYCGIIYLVKISNMNKILASYFTLSVFVSIFGILQFVLSINEYNVMINTPGRLDSILPEPSHYAIALAPAVYLSYIQIIQKTSKTIFFPIVIILSVFLTFSLTGMMVLLGCLFLAIGEQRFSTVLAMMIMSYSLYLYFPIETLPGEIEIRIVSLLGEFRVQDLQVWEIQNLSVLSLTSNLEVMLNTIQDGKIFGNGFGGHPIAYFNYYDTTPFANHYRYGINNISAHSLGIRIISEFGIIGLFALGYIFIYYSKSFNLGKRIFVACIIGRLFKIGSYIDYGLPLFFAIAMKQMNNRDIENLYEK